MPLAAGKSLSFYEILGPLGAGGMGEVYRAKDTRLDREVAIKVLPEELADDEERLRRFEREAKTLASLNHPNVAGIHGVDQQDEVCFLALELVPGEDLATRLARGPLPVDEAIDVCRQIAEGLEAAHEAGVVHRDLKPANVRITPEGVVKILDFGLAKPLRPKASSESGTTTAESDSFLMTEEGLVLGTPTYMSPEQARGKPVDRRTDIWAFGCVLYECLTGKRAFGGDSLTDVLAALVGEEPDLSLLPPLPASVRVLLLRCLAKDPRVRLRDIGEARVLLGSGDLKASETAVTKRASVRESRSLRPFAAGAVLGAAALGLGLAAFGDWTPGTRTLAPPAEVWSRFTQLTDQAGAETGCTVSPDGNSFAYASRANGSWDIYVQRVGGRLASAIAADPEREEAAPAFSPDGRQIAFHEAGGTGGIWIMGATGESARRLTDFGFDPAWSPDGEHLAFSRVETVDPYSFEGKGGIWRVAVAGGEPVELSDRDLMQPAWSPSGDRIAGWLYHEGQRDIATVPSKGGEPVILLSDLPLDWSPTWSPGGQFLFFSSDRGGSMGLWRIAVDERTGEALAEPEPVAGGLETSLSLASLPTDGRFLVFRSETTSVNPIVIPFDPETETAGTPQELTRRSGFLLPTSVSPDGEWLALYNRGDWREDLFLMRVDGTELRRLTDDAARDRAPRFSPDGSLITFLSNRSGQYGVCWIRPDGSDFTQLMSGLAIACLEPHGERLLIADFEAKRTLIASPPWPVSMDRTTVPEKIELPTGLLIGTAWSPDGTMFSGPIYPPGGQVRAGIGVYDLESGEGRELANDYGHVVPWLPDNKRLIYMTLESELVILDVETAERRVIHVDLPLPVAEEAFAVAPDGSALYYGGERVESNIWMVERGH